jgi:hypothetical protein
MVTPGSFSPSSSVMVPTIAPVSLDWAVINGERTKARTKKDKITLTFIFPPLK